MENREEGADQWRTEREELISGGQREGADQWRTERRC